MQKIFLLIACSSLCFIGCKKNRTEEPPAPVGTTVYMCGTSTNVAANITYACYWKNGTVVPLTSNTAPGSDATAEDIAVVGNDIYIVGGEKKSSGIYVAKYWKNGVVTNITDGTRTGYASAIEVKGSDVYIAFHENNASGKRVAKLWKNGVITNITDGSNNIGIYEMSVSGSDAYIVGYEFSGANRIPKYWKNGVAFTIPAVTPGSSLFTDIAVSGNDVYVSGTDFNPTQNAVLNKNGTPTWLASPGLANAWGGLFISGTDVYAGGAYINAAGNSVAAYWKNGTITSLTDDITNASASDMFIFNTDKI